MKHAIIICLLSCLVFKLSAQVDTLKKPSTIVFHVFYNDFNTAQKIRTTSLNNVINNKLWSNIGNMQMGFGFGYLKGISDHIDFVSAIDGSATDYLFKDGSIYGSNKFLLDINAGVNIKLLTDRHAVVPYLSTGAGFSLYQGKPGFYIPAGAGLQFNLFNQAFVFTNVQYRRAFGINVNDHFQYNIGIGAGIGKKKKVSAPVMQPVVAVVDTTPAAAKIISKDIIVAVTDEETGLPLPSVSVSIGCPGAIFNALSDNNGRAEFDTLKAADYKVSGTLNGISTNTANVQKSDFDTGRVAINIYLTHNDPRFTLAGTVQNKTTNGPESDVAVDVVNITQNNSMEVQSRSDGAFSVQLAANSDFIVSGKKAGYISNIDSVSTKGLNRSTTLYVKLELGIEEAVMGKNITLSNIYYDTGSAKIRPDASSDLAKLVKFLKDNPNTRIEIDSYTDSRGSAKRNMVLSQARAQGVVDYLQKNGIAHNRLVAKGYGATRLVNGCAVGVKCTEAQQAQNRRTEFMVTGN